MKSRLLPLLLLLTAGAITAWFTLRPPQETGLVLAGSVEAQTVEVGSLIGGRVAQVHSEAGQRVAAGAPLVTLESDLLDLEIATQQARIAELRANLARVVAGPRREEVARAEIDWQAAETDRKRFESLRDAGVVGQRDYDTAQVRAARAWEVLEEARRGSRAEDLAAARAALTREEGQLALLERRRKELVVTTPVPGVVERFPLRPGDLVAANQPVAEILETDQLWVRVFVPEPSLGLVALGQAAEIRVDSHPERVFTGRVIEIADQGEYTPRNLQTLDQRSDLVFGVKVRIDPAPELKAGMTALVRVASTAGAPP